MPLPRLGGADEPQRKVAKHKAAPIDATVRSWTVLHVPPTGVEAPHTVALVQADDGRQILVIIPPSIATVDLVGQSTTLVHGMRLRIAADDVGTFHAQQP